MPKPEFRWVNIDELYEPSSGPYFRCLRNHYWIMNNITNTVLFYGKYPQANPNKEVTEKLLKQYREQRIIKDEDVDAGMIHQAFVEIRLEDYV